MNLFVGEETAILSEMKTEGIVVQTQTILTLRGLKILNVPSMIGEMPKFV